jgi:hypothetical protein
MPVLPAIDKLGMIGGLAQSLMDFNLNAIKVSLYIILYLRLASETVYLKFTCLTD